MSIIDESTMFDSEYEVPIMVVDDNRDNLDLMEALLVGEGYQDVILVQDGATALEMTRDHGGIGLVLLDLMMPGMSGYEVAASLSSNPLTLDIPVIAVTGGGYVQNEALEKSFMSGAIDYIPKPINEIELYARVKVAIQLFMERKLRKLNSKKIVESENRFRVLFQEAPVGLMHLNSEHEFISVNKMFLNLTAYQHEDLIGVSIKTLMENTDESQTAQQFDQLMIGRKKEIQAVFKSQSGGLTTLTVRANLVNLHDGEKENESYILIAEPAHVSEIELDAADHSHFFDEATGLPNQHCFFQGVDRAIDAASKLRSQFSILSIQTRPIQDTEDPEKIKKIADFFNQCVRDTDELAYLGKGHFSLLLPKVRSAKDACTVAQNLLTRSEEQTALMLNGEELCLSIGLSFYPQDGRDAPTLLSNANKAMKRSSQFETKNYQMFNPSLDKQ